ncbi:SWIRM domain-containing protein [Lachnellula cervina]|uniref:SWIRM domain-containing protein n=1 Tax=Lachnellula cervina TaxID=1316786 RepID=A0A7D8YPK4_9HELO|nr:SWIRM domain-containing protein [Lachnellula cervina]
MNDKSLPSTAFGDSSSPSTSHIHSLPLPHSPASSTTYSSTFINPIVSNINRTRNMERKNPMDIKNTLMSPPEPIAQDSFSQSPSNAKTNVYSMPKGKFQHPLSPPVSPASKNSLPDDLSTITVRDPILFPNAQQSASSSQPPLFPDDDVQRVVEEHILARGPLRSAPLKEEYELVYGIKSQTMKLFERDPKRWRQRERILLSEEDAARKLIQRRYTPIAPASGKPYKPKSTGPRNSGVAKPVRQQKPKPVRERGMTPDGPRKAKSDDEDFNALQDLCPPLTSLPAKHNSLKIDWKGPPKDLSHDPHVGLLHPDEVQLASTLRLTCAMYLTSKRRIFLRKLETIRIGKEFRKTDAQQACKIDVNKASKLWSAFQKVGWLENAWVEQWL